MSYDWKQFFKFSKNLYKDTSLDIDDITKERVVVSRAYYAAFHYADDFLTFREIKTLNYGGEHDKVIRSLKNTKDPELIKLGLNLERAKKNRTIADYKDKFILNKRDVEKHLKITGEIIRNIEEIVAR